MEKIIHNKTVIAVRIKNLKNGTIPLTGPSEPLQVLLHKRKSGSGQTKAHIHRPKKRVTQNLHECLVVIKGKIKIELYSPKKRYIKTIYLSSGQSIIFMDGGHAVHILKDSEIIEVKNGPFIEDREYIK